MKKKLTAIGCHIYAGGFTLGVREHFNVLCHFEEWKFGVATVEHNLKIPVYVGEPKEWPVQRFAHGVDFVYGNPPCAPWSTARSKAGASWRADPRRVHWEHVFDLVERLEPTVWACESVRGIYQRGRDFLDGFVRSAQRRGYAATHLLTNALEHGIPQVRKRYLLVLHRVELDWKPTGLKRDAVVADMWRRKFKEAQVGSSKFLTPQVLRAMKPGDRANDVWDRYHPDPPVVDGKRKGRPSCFIRRLDLTKQSPVIAGRGEFVHPTEHRFLSVEEQAALCGYPYGYKFIGPKNVQFQQIGKAVCPCVGEYVAGIAAAGIRKRHGLLTMAPRQVEVFRDRIVTTDV